MRRRALPVLVCAVLSLSACAGDGDGGSRPATDGSASSSVATTVPARGTDASAETTAEPQESIEPVRPRVLDGSDVAGLDTGIISDQKAFVHVTWPVVPGAEALTEALADQAERRVEAYRTDNVGAFDGAGAAHPELNSTWSFTGHSPEAVGVLDEGWEFAGASSAQLWQTTWWDASGGVLDNLDLVSVDGREELGRLVGDAAEQRYGQELSAADVVAATEEGPDVLAFTEDGAMVVGFSAYTVGPGSLGLVSVELPADVTEGLLSDAGRAALAATTDPADPALAEPSPEPSSAPAPSPSTSPRKQAGRVDCAVEKCVAITYDDGPGALTRQVADAFAARGQRATFFMIGQQVDASSGTVAAVAAQGHEIGAHTWDHASLDRLAPDGVRQELASTVDALHAAGVDRVTTFRPPYGATNGSVRQVAGELGLAEVLWSVDTLDWRDRDTALVTRRVLDQARRGSIVLMHDIHPTTVAAAPAIVDGLLQRGFTLVTVDELVGGSRAGASSSTGR